MNHTEHPGAMYGLGASAGMELIRILAVLMACGAVVMGAYAFAEAGYLDEAASGVTVYFATYVRLMANNKLLVGKGADVDFANMRGIAAGLAEDWEKFLAKRKSVALAAIALAYAVVFLVFRQAMIGAFGFFNNILVLGTIGLGLAAVLTLPRLISVSRTMLREMSAAAPVASAPSVASSAPVQQAPAPAPATSPAAAKKVVRVVKKENGNV
ncbi:hypothetical protein [Tsukamurella paurometabola]|uniref:Transmembrane protein n=1 Tax=Tsukamurella paurometabola TaxID=2061 RepID=A0ABS5NFL2_TSUPA|nr:hypothetical protein [Tsukamurella paurometabola]MBS4103085.1 hypothetical protein [Tsukamurella paurometabola]